MAMTEERMGRIKVVKSPFRLPPDTLDGMCSREAAEAISSFLNRDKPTGFVKPLLQAASKKSKK
ncbi:MAG: hypothetical protein KKA90_03405 [Nanoarchaeota archaeon]|nr:hypothetical protein [Nanoarchaeota archaeon]